MIFEPIFIIFHFTL